MRKPLSSMLALVLMVSLAACGASSQPSSSTPSQLSGSGSSEISEPSSAQDVSSEASSTTVPSGPHPGMDREAVEARIGSLEGDVYSIPFANLTFNGNGDWYLYNDDHPERNFEHDESTLLHSFTAIQGNYQNDGPRASIRIVFETPTERSFDMGVSAKDFIKSFSSESEPYEMTIAGEIYDAITIESPTLSTVYACRQIDDVFIVVVLYYEEGFELNKLLSYFS